MAKNESSNPRSNLKIRGLNIIIEVAAKTIARRLFKSLSMIWAKSINETIIQALTAEASIPAKKTYD